MTTRFVTRHNGAVEWARLQGIEAERISHLDPDRIRPGDTVIGTLPVHIAAEVCAQGGCYLHLSMIIPEDARGRELTADEMNRFGATLEEYHVRRQA